MIDAERLAHSWHEGCPVAAPDLRLVGITYWDFEGKVNRGEIVVNYEVAEQVLEVFSTLFAAGYPMTSVTPVGDLDQETINDPGQNNTSGFNCRFVAGTSTWSEHARGLAIDINPQQNPLVDGEAIDPPEAHIYTDRSLAMPGMIEAGDVVVTAFESIGWTWGGTWETKKDYHHFSATGR